MPTRNPRSTRAAPVASASGVRAMLAALKDGVVRASYGPKQTVFTQGEVADAVFYIESGEVQICVVSEQGKEGVIGMLGAEEFFGEGCLAGQPLHMASAIVRTQAVVTRIPKQTMIRALHQEPTFADVFTAFLLSRNIQIEADLVDQLFNSSERRLARTLLLLANFGKDGKMEMVIPKINQDLLAARVGTTRSRINFFMNKFRKLGFIDYNGTLKVHSSLLNVIVNDPIDAPDSRRALGRKRKAAPKRPRARVEKGEKD
jgi:CRP/FNR family transcriptional regulator, cyclic AMP receptor protein